MPTRSVGRPKAEIDWDKVGKMLEAGGFAKGIAATIGIDEATLYRRCEADNKVNFATFRQQKVAKGDELLRAKQFQVAMTGDRTLLVWLGKQRLDQTDRKEITHTIDPMKGCVKAFNTLADQFVKDNDRQPDAEERRALRQIVLAIPGPEHKLDDAALMAEVEAVQLGSVG